MSKNRVFSGPYFPSVFSLNIAKYGPEKNPYLDTFKAVLKCSFIIWVLYLADFNLVACDFISFQLIVISKQNVNFHSICSPWNVGRTEINLTTSNSRLTYIFYSLNFDVNIDKHTDKHEISVIINIYIFIYIYICI